MSFKQLFFVSVFIHSVLTCFGQTETMPFLFCENTGQWRKEVIYKGSTSYNTVSLMKDGVSFCAAREQNTITNANNQNAPSFDYLVWNLKFVNAHPNPKLSAEKPSPHNSHFFLGKDTTKWKTHIRNFKVIKYHKLYNHIDLHYYGLPNGNLKYDFVVHPLGKIGDIRLAVNGINGLTINEKGELEITTPWGTLIEKAPYTYQIVKGKKVEIDVKYRLISPNSFGFITDDQYNEDIPLVIDPQTMVWSTFMGATGLNTNNYAYALTLDQNNNVLITGYCDNTFPITPGVYQSTNAGNLDVFVAKLSRDGTSLLWSTYLGGNQDDLGFDIETNSSGNVYVTGHTRSTNFPVTTGAYQTTFGGNIFDAFVICLNANGTALNWSTFLGGSGDETGYNISTTNSGKIYVYGHTISNNFPTTTGAFQTTTAGGWEAFLSCISNNGTNLSWSTYLGGSSTEFADGMRVSDSGKIYVTGVTYSGDFPVTTGVFQGTLSGTSDAYVACIDSTGSSLNWASYLGGSNDEFAHCITIDPFGAIVLSGFTSSPNFPSTTGSFQPTYSGNQDVFVAKTAANGTSIQWASFLGGNDEETSFDIQTNVNGHIYLVGYTQSSDFPVTNGAYQTTYDALNEIFVTAINKDGDSIMCSTYLGGDGNDYRYPEIGIDDKGTNDTIYVNLTTHSTNFVSTPGVYQPNKLNTFQDQPAVVKMSSCITTTISNCVFNPTINGPTFGCIGDTLTLSASPGSSFNWSTGDTLQIAEVHLLSDTVITVIISLDTCGTDTVSHVISAKSIAGITFNNTAADCNDSNGTAMAQPNTGTSPFTYQWDDSNSQTNSMATGLSQGLYRVTVVDSFGCNAMDSIVIGTVSGPHVIKSDSMDVFCKSKGFASVAASGGTSPYTYLWSNTQTDSIATGLIEGTWTVTVIDANACDTIIKFQLVLHDSVLDATINGTNQICEGDSVYLVAAGGSLYQWSDGSTNDSIFISPLGTTTYRVTVTDSTCSDTASINVMVSSSPNFELSGDTVLCENGTGKLKASGASGYLWSNGETSEEITVENLTPGIHWYTVTATTSCDTIVDSINVNVLSRPSINAGSDTTVLSGEAVQLMVTSTLDPTTLNYSWSPPSGLSCIDCKNPIASPSATTKYYVHITDDFGCTNTDSLQIIIELLCGNIAIPNAFSPNGDGENDEFIIRTSGLSSIRLIIYDRWGNKVFESTDINQTWDGSHQKNGQNYGSGVFVYFVKAVCPSGEVIERKGNISLVK